MATIKDIALKTNTSPSTVSRVLRADGTFSVTEETRLRILDAAREMNYRVKRTHVAQPDALLSKKQIGLVQFWGATKDYWDGFYVSMRAGIERRFSELGFDSTNGLRIFGEGDSLISAANDLDGLIVIGGDSSFDHRIYESLQNVVFLDADPPLGNYDCVDVDFSGGTYDALTHLFDMGHRDIGFIGGELNDTRVNQRLEVYKAFVSSKGLLDMKHVRVGGWTAEDGYRAMREMVEQQTVPSALFIASDNLAMGAIRSLSDNGFSVPNDISIVSFNDVEFAKFISPPLTTVRVPTEFIGDLGVRMLCDRFTWRNRGLKVTVPTELVVRNSCQPFDSSRGSRNRR